MIGAFIYASLALAAAFLVYGAKRKSRLGASLGVLFFALALAGLSAVHTSAHSYWLAVLYGVAAASQVYTAIRTWHRWPRK